VAAAGQRLGIWLRVQRLDGTFSPCLPAACQGLQPADWRNLILASGGCNTGPRDFSAGLPLDWTNSILVGSGSAWAQSGIGGSAAYCGANVTGASGAAACVASSGYTSSQSAARLVIPLPTDLPQPMAGQDPPRIVFRLNFQSAVLGTDYVSFDLWSSVYGWMQIIALYGNEGNPAGTGIAVGLGLSSDLGQANLIVTHYTAGGTAAGGWAQIDDFELTCPESP
jgi:hypothetical protein